MTFRKKGDVPDHHALSDHDALPNSGFLLGEKKQQTPHKEVEVVFPSLAYQDSETLSEFPLMAHLAELRKRLIWMGVGFVICFLAFFPCSHVVFQWILRPIAPYLGASHEVIYTALYEQFFVEVRLALWGGVFLAMPWMLCQIWLFVAPALYKAERRFFATIFLLTPVFFTVGVLFVFFVVIPAAWHFFAGFQSLKGGIHVVMLPKVSEYLDLMLHLMFAFGLAFELPILIVLLVKMGILSISLLVRLRKYALLGAFIVSAILTPPDPLSQIFLAVPLYTLYEMAIIFVRVMVPSDKVESKT